MRPRSMRLEALNRGRLITWSAIAIAGACGGSDAPSAPQTGMTVAAPTTMLPPASRGPGNMNIAPATMPVAMTPAAPAMMPTPAPAPAVGGSAGASAAPAPPAAATPDPTAGAPFPKAMDFAATGAFETVAENNVGPDNAFTLFRPAELGASGVVHPIITWGNGTGAMPSSYTALLQHLASHGFIVIASNNTNVGSGDEMLAGVDWVQSENERSGSPMFGKVNAARSGATGHSQGGAGACAAARDARIVTIAPIQGGRSCEQMPPKVPAIWFTGSADNIAVPDEIKAVYESVPGPAMYAMLAGATHFTPPGNGGGFRGPVTAWFRAHLMADEDARAVFYGEDCGLCIDPGWEFETRNQ
jgi:hypothetical protein